jgi:hypothetical protein
VTKRYDLARRDLEKLRKAENGATIRNGLVTFGTVHDLFAGEVANLKPPKNAEKPNELLAVGARDVTIEVNKLVSALPVTKDPRQALKTLNAIRNGRGAAEEARALRQLKKLGYIDEG